ncbi:MAG TPA: hypothetical protein PKG67_14950 [Turneriella sp.]|nr:hypothetical protein [Turneriella sp.]
MRGVINGLVAALVILWSPDVTAGAPEDLMRETGRDFPGVVRIEAILKKGVDLNAVMPDGNPLAIHLYMNILKHTPEAVRTRQLLLRYGADPNARIVKGFMKGLTLLMLADAATAELLLIKGADPFLKDGSGDTALDHARAQKDQAKIRLLEKAMKR